MFPETTIFFFRPNRPDLFQTTVQHSLLKTKYLAVTVRCGCCGSLRGTKRPLYDLRADYYDCLRYHIACYDGARCCYQHLYDLFLSTVHMLIDRCVPVKYISLEPHDPAYVTPW